ncbi:MAG: FxsA cytoplasmic rane protein [Frankiales bacterium]|nr:FxsA cytoplasmic rane protein [Frankiales bacterium]
MFPLIVVAFIVVPIVEIYVLIQVGQQIGVWWTVALLLADGFLGAWLFKREGRRTWTAFNDALRAGRFPGKEVGNGALVLVGGTLLLSPGFVTDVVGALFLLPPTRGVARRVLMRVLRGRFGILGVLGDPGAGPRMRTPPSRDEGVIEGEAVRRDEPPTPPTV